MQLNALITNHGKHSNEKLAVACASDIVQIGADAAGEQAIEGRKLENKIIDIMEVHFAAVAKYEHDQLAAKGAAQLAASLDAHPQIWDDAVAGIMAAVKASPIAGWFDAAEIEKNVRTAVGKWVKVSQHMHRDWFARHGKIGHGTKLEVAPNRDAGSEYVKRWIDMHQGDGETLRQAVHEHASALAAA